MFKAQVKTQHYFKKKYENLSRFISYYYQISLVRSLDVRSVLEIGKGNGLVSDYLKKAGLEVSTVDFDESLKPDYVADVRNMSVISKKFDVVAAFEILEHIPYKDFNKALGEINKKAEKYAIISLPYRSTGFEFVLKFPGIRTIFKKSFLSLFFRIPLKFGGIKISGQHYWEIDGGKWKLSKIRKEINKVFKIKKELRPPLDYYHYFFVLENKNER